MRRKFFFIALMAAALSIGFTSCGDDSDDDDVIEEVVENTGGTLTVNGTTYELTTAGQWNHGKKYMDQDMPRNYIELFLYKKVEKTISKDGQENTHYDTLHYLNIGLFCNDDLLSPGTYTFENTAGHQTWLNSHVWINYEVNNVGEVFQQSGDFVGNVVIEKTDKNYKVTLNWDEGQVSASYTGPIPSVTDSPLLKR